ncbi:MAG: hypothetical protein IPH62_19615 [Ignavibacteriae bacterium]|nr:hypothetical protein [Ignavibacteriota bacterium]
MSFSIDLTSIDKEINKVEESVSVSEEVIAKEETEIKTEIKTEAETKETISGKFNINLEHIVEMENIKSDPIYINLATALVTGRAVNKLISEREEARNEEYLSEVRGLKKNVVRHGQIKSVIECPPGYKSNKGRCIRMSSVEIISLAKRARKAAITRHRHENVNAKKSMKSMKLSDKIRAKNASRMKITKMV